ncbi:WD repeat-containing protein 25 isoform X3 [Bubalus kerabau]|uniref:WD repeat-containing protein 25 isoform X3 n=1 Tax=Bubalus carabanensis TaxID=3119969 RepID=UPI00244E871F|nr:WD repeat-containing protein 25 isoform X3 [Bubalus carabanensis]
MASLVAYEDSDSEAETEPAGGFHPAGQMEDSWTVLRPPGQDFGSRGLDATGRWAPSLVCGSRDDPATCRLPLARLWSQDPGSCPSQRLRWPRPEPEAALPASPPARPSLWTSQAPAGHVPLAAARSKQVRVCWEPSSSPEPSLDAHTGSEGPGKGSSSLQRKRREDCVVPYTPKRLRPLQALSTESDSGKDTEAQGPLAGRVPAPLCVAPEVSEFIQPYLDSQYKETKIPKTVLFHLRGHRGPVNSVQWCPVSARSHMLLSTSMDKTFKYYRAFSRISGTRVIALPRATLSHLIEFSRACQLHFHVWNAVDSGSCLQTYSLHSEAVRAARWSPCGRRILSGGFDFALHLTDLETGTQLFSGRSDFRITTLKFHPRDHSVFVCGGFSSEMKAWDVRTSKDCASHRAGRIRHREMYSFFKRKNTHFFLLQRDYFFF